MWASMLVILPRAGGAPGGGLSDQPGGGAPDILVLDWRSERSGFGASRCACVSSGGSGSVRGSYLGGAVLGRAAALPAEEEPRAAGSTTGLEDVPPVAL